MAPSRQVCAKRSDNVEIPECPRLLRRVPLNFVILPPPLFTVIIDDRSIFLARQIQTVNIDSNNITFDSAKRSNTSEIRLLHFE